MAFVATPQFKHSLQLSFILLASIAAHVTSARVLPSSHKSFPLLFPQNLQGSRKGHNIEGIHGVKKYLKRYGYLPHHVEAETNSQPDAFDDHLESAVKTYQKFFQLNVSGILDEETLSLMSQPRCAVPDIFHNETSRHGHGHEHLHMGSHYAFFPNTPKWPESKYRLRYKFIHEYPATFKDPVMNAFELWSAYSQFGFLEVSEGDWAHITISFEWEDHGDGHPFRPGSGVLAHAFAPQDGRLHFNVELCWSLGPPRPTCFDVMSVALHEIGHLLGLAHSSTEDAIMWPSIRPNTVKGLYEDDIAGIKALYA